MHQSTDPLHVPEAHTSVFSSVVRDATAGVHREAERSGFVADLIRARATREGYAIYLRNLLPIYEALEDELSRFRATSGVAAAFATPSLARRTALVADLENVAGAAWRARLPVLPETASYAQAIEAAGRDVTGTSIAAHAYARYLGDLSGGQILKTLLSRTLALTPVELAFYDFPDLADPAAAKAEMRVAIDGITDAAGQGCFVEQAKLAFQLTIRLSIAIQAEAARG